MEGESEYGFWHVLVRDVCYGQIPRAARAARHQAAAAWTEEKAGERAEDLADVLAYHYQAALQLHRAAGVGEQAEELQAQAVRYLALAGARALSLDVEQAERQLAFALELAPAGDPERASLLERWAQAVQQQGRLQEARQALEQALAHHRDEGDPVAAGRVLTRLSLVLFRLGDPSGSQAMMDEALDLLEAQPAGPELVAAYTYQAGGRALRSQPAQAIVAAKRALALAAEVGIPEPAFALHWRGLARCQLREADGLADIRRALRLALEQGLGREAAVIHLNLAWTCSAYDGPAAALEVVQEGIAFCEQRGIREVTLSMRAASLTFLAELGQTEQALAEVGPLADRLEAAGDISYLDSRVLQLRLLAECGTPQQITAPEEFVTTVREIGIADVTAIGLTSAAQLLLAQGQPEQAHALLHELDELPGGPPHLGGLPSLLRAALALGDPPLAQRLATGIEPVTPRDEHAVASAQAQLAEAAGDRTAAAELYRDAAERWRQFGNVPERAYALLGQGRCLTALGKPEAEAPLREAHEFFTTLAYQPALAETQTLLGESEAAAV
jgi:tetratricopeptide (TPR) repeat protein